MNNNYFQIVLMVFATSLFASNVFAQGAYVNINAGYGLNMSSQNLPGFYNETIDNNSHTYEQVNVSLGKGLDFGGAFEYMFNKNIGAELGISYLLGDKSNMKKIDTTGILNSTYSSKMFRIIPSFIVASGFNKINPYAKFGLIIASGSILIELNDKENNGDIIVIKEKLNKGIALGLSSKIGVIFTLNNKISLYGELNVISLSFAPNRGEITEATHNGADLLQDMSKSEKEFQFVDNYTYYTSNSDDQPSKELKQKLPYSSFGINIGLKINLLN